jgi:hypothetical protein
LLPDLRPALALSRRKGRFPLNSPFDALDATMRGVGFALTCILDGRRNDSV